VAIQPKLMAAPPPKVVQPMMVKYFTSLLAQTTAAFPLTLCSRRDGKQFVVRRSGYEIEIHRLTADGEDWAGSLVIRIDGTDWSIKNVTVADDLQGQGIGKALVYCFANLAVLNGAKRLHSATPNGAGLYLATGFEVTPLGGRAIQVSGDPRRIRDTARRVVDQQWIVTPGLPPPPPPLRNDWIESRANPQNNQFGDPRIGNSDL